MLISITLSQLLERCAPNVGERTMSAVVAYESGAREDAIGDNTARRSYFPASKGDARALAERLLKAGHDIDVGYAQVNSNNFRAYHLTAAMALEPCTNLATGALILQAAYAGAVHKYGPGQRALAHALSAYNTGGYWAGMAYAHGVYAAARALRYESTRGKRRAFAFTPAPLRASAPRLAERP